MGNITPTQVPIHELLARRYSPYGFDARPVPPYIFQRLLEAARWSPSCFNAQPWNFLIATRDNPGEYDRMLGCLVDANQAWAKSAPVLMITVAALNFSHNGKPNRHAYHDVGAAMANLTLQATSEGIYVHQMGGIDFDKTRAVYGIPATHDAVAGVAMGYPADPNTLPDPLKQRALAPRSRKAVDEFAFAGKWGDAMAPLSGSQGESK